MADPAEKQPIVAQAVAQAVAVVAQPQVVQTTIIQLPPKPTVKYHGIATHLICFCTGICCVAFCPCDTHPADVEP